MSGDLDGRVVLVTGAASGIGQATALEVAGRGGSVLALDRDADGLAATCELVQGAAGASAIEVAIGDVGDEDTVAEAVARAVGAFGRLDGVVTSAGIFAGEDLQPLENISLDTFLQVLRVNLAGTFLAIKHALPHLRRDEGEPTGSVVTVASTAAIRGHGFGAGYTASKGGVAALTRLVAVQGGPQGIRANCICPGGVDTPMAAGTWSSDEARARLKRTVPLGCVAQASDIAAVAGFLLSSASRHVTGQVFAVDGGATTT
jgi:NAD(P)-dependent dehydrogenase (short-subunit alcohol dehydrogenase family)